MLPFLMFLSNLNAFLYEIGHKKNKNLHRKKMWKFVVYGVSDVHKTHTNTRMYAM